MFESASKILDKYIKIGDRQLWRFDIYSIDAERGENPEDLYYLCNVRGSWFIIFETDYIHSLDDAVNEAMEIFGRDKVEFLCWITKRDEHGIARTLPGEAARNSDHLDNIVSNIEGTYLRCAVMQVEYKPLAGKTSIQDVLRPYLQPENLKSHFENKGSFEVSPDYRLELFTDNKRWYVATIADYLFVDEIVPTIEENFPFKVVGFYRLLEKQTSNDTFVDPTIFKSSSVNGSDEEWAAYHDIVSSLDGWNCIVAAVEPKPSTEAS